MKKDLLIHLLPETPTRKFLAHVLLLSCFLIGAAPESSNAQVSIVKDIAPGNYNDPEAFKSMKVHHSDGNLYFIFNNELWKSDGSTAGTVKLAGFDYVGYYLVSSGKYVYFLAQRYDGENGTTFGEELWRSDGTAEGTIMLRDIYPGEYGGNIFSLTDVNGTLFFTARNLTNGQELWKSDGTTEGTKMVKDILRVSGSSNPRSFAALNGKLYFSANDGQNGYELWTSDGTDAGTVMVKNINTISKASSSPEELININGTLYFTANDGVNGKQLWKSTGAIGNATLVKVINPGGNSYITDLAKLGSRVFFVANDGVHGNELWASNGTASGTYMVKDLTPGPGSATAYATPHIEFINEANGKIYFLAVAQDYTDLWASDGTDAGTVQITFRNNPGFPWRHFGVFVYNGVTYFGGMGYDYPNYLELWKTNGTAAGTSRVYENIGDGYYGTPHFTVYKNKFYFIAHGGELRYADGTPSGMVVVKRFGQQAGSNPGELTDINGKLFFSAGDYYDVLWQSDGTASGTFGTEQSFYQIDHITNVNGTVYFSGMNFNNQKELYTSDGTYAGTVIVTDLTDDPNGWNQSSEPHNLIEYNGKLHFAAKSPFHGYHLFESDGTEEGTKTVVDKPYHEQGFANPEELTKAGGKLYFTAVSAWGRELFVYDGVSDPKLTRDIKLHYQGSHPINLIGFKGNLYFQADNRGNGYELWRSDGTATGTVMLKDIRRDDLGSGETLAPVDISNMVATPDLFYFAAIKSTGVNSLWKSDGTTTGTRPVVDFAGSPTAHMIGASANLIVYSLTYDTHYELWSSNGTATGTKLLMRADGAHSESNQTSNNGVHYMITFNYSTAGYHIFRTDGTVDGTYEIQFDGVPQSLGASGGKVYLSLDHPDYGWELFTIQDNGANNARIASQSNDEAEMVTAEDEAMFSSYPNPFASELSLRVAGEENQSFRMKVLNMNGGVVEEKVLEYNRDHAIGQTWRDGFYLLQVYRGEKMITKKIIKKS